MSYLYQILSDGDEQLLAELESNLPLVMDMTQEEAGDLTFMPLRDGTPIHLRLPGDIAPVKVKVSTTQQEGEV